MSKRTCVVVEDGKVCARSIYGNGMCSKHYQRWWKHGDPLVNKRGTRGTCPVVVDGSVCGLPNSADGMCNKHWQRWKRNGDPLITKTGGVPRGSRRTRYDDLRDLISDPDEGCIEWPYSRDKQGYGRVFDVVLRRTRPTNAVSCEMSHGPAPNGKPFALHSCDNPPCVNPRHLAWGDNSENQRQSVERGRSRWST